jgi:hypothetical protein
VSSIGLALFAFALARAERGLAAEPSPTPAEPAPGAPPPIVLLGFVILLFAFGYQVHFAINSTPAYLRFAAEERLPELMPIFWVGFNLGLVPATLLVKRFGGSAMLAAGGMLGVVAFAGCTRAPSLEWLMLAQVSAGVAWSIALTAAFTAALAAGKPNRQGLLTGILFSVLAAAAIVRMVILLSGKQGAVYLENVPFIAWSLAAFLIAMAAFPEKTRSAPGR